MWYCINRSLGWFASPLIYFLSHGFDRYFGWSKTHYPRLKPPVVWSMPSHLGPKNHPTLSFWVVGFLPRYSELFACVCVCITYIYIYIYIYVQYIYIYLFTYLCIYLFLHMYVYIYTCTYICQNLDKITFLKRNQHLQKARFSVPVDLVIHFESHFGFHFL